MGYLIGGLPRVGWRTELPLFLAAYATYTLARWLFAGDFADAQEHARWIYELEQTTHVAVEGSVQRAFDSDAASRLLGNLYLAAQLAVVPGALIWLYRRSPGLYRDLRNTVLATWLIAVPVFALFPVAPPRLAQLGLADTVSQQAAVELTGRSTTGNHYVFDIAAGVLVTALGFVAGRLGLRQPRTAFVLSGGASLGALQVGMLRALYERHVVPDLLVGTSAGALNAALVASRPQTPATAEQLARIWRAATSGSGRPGSSTRSARSTSCSRAPGSPT